MMVDCVTFGEVSAFLVSEAPAISEGLQTTKFVLLESLLILPPHRPLEAKEN